MDILSFIESDIRKLNGEPEKGNAELEDEDVSITKAKLDNGIGKRLFQQYRDTKKGSHEASYCGEYVNIILAAHMMSVGANLDEEDRAYLCELVPKVSSLELAMPRREANARQVPSRYGYNWPIGDNGFREPGRVQFEHALSIYTNGEPHEWLESYGRCLIIAIGT